ncbi:MAG: phosphoglucosamine mutase [Selenomonas sp.]|nr:phosphoglucosamine mutase [Selenomonas sp.]MBQ1919949.1 phosphoglucosamine mutase [Selenomonas sp.]MBQ2087430.1 phosphoglucosamine mutase [Selenomonas sp.]MBQ4213271.1 phosphoglucosamine mutase [Selenomonas sp.]MBQ5502265.1 phosphoglucosamine mutase [Selenomonas sp.]
MARLFGTDGVRGEANVSLTPELAYRLGRAATIYFGRDTEEQPLILIGRDTRLSGEMFEAALTAGICSAGGRAMLAGVIPTPAIAYLARRHKAKAGIVISASHNPFHDNGIKFFGGDGYKLPDAVEDELEAIVHKLEENDDMARPTGENIGHIEYRTDLLNQYIEFVISTCQERFDGMKVVLDCSNGAAYQVMPKVLRELGAKVKVIHALPNGVNINDKCGSTHMESLQKAVVENKADFGIAHDGDADRCLCVDEKGQIIDGDHILVMCAQDMMKKGTLPHNTVVSTVMANIGFHKAIKEAGGRVEVTQVGDRYVLENMLKSGYKIGGEQSGHIIFTDYSTTGDGPITALQVLASLKRSGRKASELTALMTTYPQLLVNVRVATKEGWEDNKAIAEAIAKGEAELGNDGRILVRPSGTEPLIRVMAEGPDQAQLETICNAIADVVKKEQG